MKRFVLLLFLLFAAVCGCFNYNAAIMNKAHSLFSDTSTTTSTDGQPVLVTGQAPTLAVQNAPSATNQEDLGNMTFVCTAQPGTSSGDALASCTAGIQVQTKARFQNTSLSLIYNGFTTNCTLLDQSPLTPPQPPKLKAYLFSCGKYPNIGVIQEIGKTGYAFIYVSQPPSGPWNLTNCPGDKIYHYNLSVNSQKLHVAVTSTSACS